MAMYSLWVALPLLIEERKKCSLLASPLGVLYSLHILKEACCGQLSNGIRDFNFEYHESITMV